MLVHQNSIVKLKANKQELDTLRARVQVLEHENSRLAVRAAVGFDQLTPRPQLDSVSIPKTQALNYSLDGKTIKY